MIEILMTIKDRQDYLDRQIAYLIPYLSSELSLSIYDDGSLTPLVLPVQSDHISLVRGDVNVGLIEARNILLSKSSSKSKYVLFLDDDIFIHNFKLFLDDASKFLSEDESLLAVSCPYINLPTRKYAEISTFKKIIDTDKSDSGYVVYFFGGTSVFDRHKLISMGGLEGKYRIYLEEEDLALRAYASSLYFKVLYQNNYIAIHDQAPGKDFKGRSMFLLSNRMLFHYKFVKNPIVRIVLNFSYIILYFLKHRSFYLVRDAIARYKSHKAEFDRCVFSFPILLNFFKKRFF